MVILPNEPPLVSLSLDLPDESEACRPIRPLIDSRTNARIEAESLGKLTVVANHHLRRTVTLKRTQKFDTDAVLLANRMTKACSIT